PKSEARTSGFGFRTSDLKNERLLFQSRPPRLPARGRRRARGDAAGPVAGDSRNPENPPATLESPPAHRPLLAALLPGRGRGRRDLRGDGDPPHPRPALPHPAPDRLQLPQP